MTLELSELSILLQNMASTATVVGAVLIPVQLFCSHRSNKRNNELKNCPDFYFTAPEQCSRFGVGYCSGGDFIPELIEDCSGTNYVYLFNIVNCGKFAAKDVRICVLAEHESSNIMAIDKDRWIEINHCSGFPSEERSGDMHQVCTRKGKLNIFAEERSFYILLEYKSSYTNKKYKRIYECCIKDSIDMETSSHDYNENNQILSAVKGEVKQKYENLLERSEGMGFKRPVAVHDIKLINENHFTWKKVISISSAKARKKFTHIQPLKDWLLDI